MATVELNLPHHQYRILIEPGLIASLGQHVRAVAPHARAALLCDHAVYEHHGDAAETSLTDAGYTLVTESLDMGEQRKTLDTVRGLYDVLVDNRLERKSPVISLGGGVMGDTVGFVASSYLRGVPLIQCPTTLLAMVDASVGGKVGVNLPQGKNLIGAFYQPELVVIDVDTLKTLSPRQFRCGLAECIKHGVIRDPALFEWIGEQSGAIAALDPAALVDLVERNVRIKAGVVMADEKEAGQRAHLNFGHTFAHAIEAMTAYGTFEHGEAVSLGMVAAARLAEAIGKCDAGLSPQLVTLLDRVGLPTSSDGLPATDALMEAMALDKKVAAGRIRFVLPTRLGEVVIDADVPPPAVRDAWESLRR